MATLKPFDIPSLKLWFWSLDHEPPHFHAKRAGEWEVKVNFMRAPGEMIELVWTNKLPARSVLKGLTRLAEEHRLELFEQWEEVHRN